MEATLPDIEVVTVPKVPVSTRLMVHVQKYQGQLNHG